MASRVTSAEKSKPGPGRSGFALRPKLIAALALVVLLGWSAHRVWLQYAPSVRQQPQYLVTAEQIHITAPPPWVHSNIRNEVLRDAALVGTISLLEDGTELNRRIENAFEFHPWVKSVRRITKGLPPSIHVELEYRRPLAAIETTGPHGKLLVPVDAEAVRLPDADFTDNQRLLLPRIVNIETQTLRGQEFHDPRVRAGLRLIERLEQAWQALELVSAVPSPEPETGAEGPRYVFRLVTRGGTRIDWGAVPGEEPQGEATAEEKLARLLQYVEKNHNLQSTHGPEVIDVRRGLVVVPRTAKEEGVESTDAEIKR